MEAGTNRSLKDLSTSGCISRFNHRPIRCRQGEGDNRWAGGRGWRWCRCGQKYLRDGDQISRSDLTVAIRIRRRAISVSERAALTVAEEAVFRCGEFCIGCPATLPNCPRRNSDDSAGEGTKHSRANRPASKTPNPHTNLTNGEEPRHYAHTPAQRQCGTMWTPRSERLLPATAGSSKEALV